MKRTFFLSPPSSPLPLTLFFIKIRSATNSKIRRAFTHSYPQLPFLFFLFQKKKIEHVPVIKNEIKHQHDRKKKMRKCRELNAFSHHLTHSLPAFPFFFYF
ncbi:hypothetical protein, unlikely [Trypanosoma brucei gambiense DAL972]|uniref:Uncharacterized protein n=1 Tax=Trypanosoma brucei gambiense (strain MHOM/CI/86/DAL972) TaxID=679716 RepID=C9ZPA3_TRYB9|nr:hypothetical protein, unlikely [Trypanosoma brucei gambiense DAL972]CBH11231.1 hypothetical protein, unlikely [Trypanosoma brucei gambiense DAL972]|eukprot:XP_011773518.1 hypothetical protein, unlikely [Trypanosoma brucei gambiense DAL972]